MRTWITTLILTLSAANLAYADDGNGRYAYEDIALAAHVLEDAASHFHRQLKHDIGRHHLTKDAKRFAKATRHFHRQVERGSSYRHLRDDYAELARAYVHVRHEFGGRHTLHHDRHFRGDFRAVERAYHQLNRAIHDAQVRYSSDWRHDRDGRGYDRRQSQLEIALELIFGS